jgi:hypothetical protein
MFSDPYNDGNWEFKGGPYGPYGHGAPWTPPYEPPPGFGGGGSGSYPSSASSSPSPQSKTDAPKQTSLGMALLILGLFVVLPVVGVVWMLLKFFDF